MGSPTLPREISSLDSAEKVYKKIENPRRDQYRQTIHLETNLRYVELRHCVLSKCTLNNCLLIQCLVEDCHAINSTLNNCAVTDEIVTRPITTSSTPRILDSRIRSSYIEDCRMKNTKIFGSKVCGGQVAWCTAETSTFKGGSSGESNNSGITFLSYGSSFQECKIEDGNFCQGSKFHGCQLERCEDEGSEHTSSSLSFRNFPAELREHIMKSAFEKRYGDGTSARYSRDDGSFMKLIKALRGFPLFYNEALDVWYKNSLFYLHGKHRCKNRRWKYDDECWGPYAGLRYNPRIDSGQVLRVVQRVGIPSCHSNVMGLPQRLWLKGISPANNSIRELHVDFSVGDDYYRICYGDHSLRYQQVCQDLSQIGTRWLPRLGAVQKLSITFEKLIDLGEGDKFPDIVAKVDLRMGVKGEAVFTIDAYFRPLTYVWTAVPGKSLSWNTQATA